MSKKDPLDEPLEETLLVFPCEFPIKIMGKNQLGFHQAVIEILKKHLSDFDTTKFNEVESKQKNYCSITVIVNATSQEHLDGIYIDLSASEWVKFAL
ncbi:MAG: YbeD family protein [Gammaproteobacteria bacterium]